MRKIVKNCSWPNRGKCLLVVTEFEFATDVKIRKAAGGRGRSSTCLFRGESLCEILRAVLVRFSLIPG